MAAPSSCAGRAAEPTDSSPARRPDGTATMVDAPRGSPSPAARYQALDPVTEGLLTHRDHAEHGRRRADRVRFESLLPGHGGRQHLARELRPRPFDFSAIRW